MALDKQLKSKMTGTGSKVTTPLEPVKQQEPLRQVVASEKPSAINPPFAQSKLDTTETAAPTSEPKETISDEAILIAIEKQIQSLNNNVTELQQGINCQNKQKFYKIVESIESARINIENHLSRISSFESSLKSILEKQDRNDRQLTQTLRENMNFQVQVRQGMQRDLDILKTEQNDEKFNPILKEIAVIFVEYQAIIDEELTLRQKNNLKALFEQLEDLLTDYDAEICRSEIGTVRQTRLCKIINKIPTSKQEKHNTIAQSRKYGVVRGRTVLYKELVDVFVFDPTLTPANETILPSVRESEMAKPIQSSCADAITTTEADTLEVDNETNEGEKTPKTDNPNISNEE